MSKSLPGFRLVIGAVTRKGKTRKNTIRREQRREQKGSQSCEECGHKTNHKHWEAHFHYALRSNSALHVLMKGYLRELGNFRKEGKLNDQLQEDFKAEYEKQQRELR